MNNQPIDPLSSHYQRPHDRWHCAAADDASCGGSGEHLDSSIACRVRPSLRMKRGVFVATCTALILGVLLAVLTGPLRNEVLAPGPLTRAHAGLLLDHGTNRCSACHGAGDRTLGDWISDAVAGGRHIPVSQSQLCMDCHDQSLMQQFALLPHNMAPAKLAALTAASPLENPFSGIPVPTNDRGELACATCHREHHGAEFNLTALTDRQCQTCHAGHIHSFETNHPEFTNWPFEDKQASIRFDHSSHMLKHFPDQKASFECRTCHIDDERGVVKLVAPFAQSCASCHSGQIHGAESTRWTFFQLPMLDTQALAAAGHSVGHWPAACDGDFDGRIPAAMKLLLAADPEVMEILSQRGPNFEFGDLNPDDPRDLADAARLGWAIKQLVHDLADTGSPGIRNRLGTALARLPDDTAGAEHNPILNAPGLAAGLHPTVFARARDLWLPELTRELTRQSIDGGGIASQHNRRVLGRPVAMRIQDNSDLLIDNPLPELMKNPPTTKMPAVVIQTPHSSDEGNGVVTNSHVPQPSARTDELLVQNPLANQTTADARIPDAGSPPSDEQLRRAVRDAVIKLPDPRPGGWYRDDQCFSISYRLTGHADPVIKSWTDLASQHANDRAVTSSGLFGDLTSENSAGTCLTCHAIHTDSSGTRQVAWNPRYRETRVRGFTRFSHRPHDIQSSLSDCTSCHRPKRPGEQATTGTIAGLCSSDFDRIEKAACASCHRAGGAPSGCVDCHNYHIGSPLGGNAGR